MYQTGVSITVLILKTVADVWKEIGYLADIKRWTEVIGQNQRRARGDRQEHARPRARVVPT